jgi:hypothetical protein
VVTALEAACTQVGLPILPVLAVCEAMLDAAASGGQQACCRPTAVVHSSWTVSSSRGGVQGGGSISIADSQP